MSTPVRCRTVFHAVILATALTATLAVPPAHAHSPCDPTDNDRAEASRVLAGLTREIDVMEATIVEALACKRASSRVMRRKAPRR